MPLPAYIEPIQEGDAGPGKTLLSVEKANELIAVCNAILNVRGINGVRVHKSDAGMVIELEQSN